MLIRLQRSRSKSDRRRVQAQAAQTEKSSSITLLDSMQTSEQLLKCRGRELVMRVIESTTIFEKIHTIFTVSALHHFVYRGPFNASCSSTSFGCGFVCTK